MMKKILIVDDSAMIRMQVRRTLQEAGFRTREAVDGLDAFEKLSAESVDLIVCDVNMPRMSGLELLERLKEESTSKAPILMLTTEAQPEMIRLARSLGARGWLIKPFKPELLVSAVSKMAA